MDVYEKIKYHHNTKKYCKILRKVGHNTIEKSNGYMVDYSENFVLLQEVDDFDVVAYNVFTIQSIKEIQFSNSERYFDKILHWEGIFNKVQNKYKINLTTWNTIFKSIRKLNLNVIIENEDPDDNSFDIGPIIRVAKSAVYLRYFNPQGLLDVEITKISWHQITIVKFDDRYINIFSKYLRERKTIQSTKKKNSINQ